MQAQRLRNYGIKIGVLETGQQNAITDVRGVLVGYQTLQLAVQIRKREEEKCDNKRIKDLKIICS